MSEISTIYQTLKEALYQEVKQYDLFEKPVTIRCKPISSEEAIGNPEEKDYPIIKGSPAAWCPLLW